jgi:hypothetical protein
MRERIQGERDRRAATRHSTAAAPEIPTKPDPSAPECASPNTARSGCPGTPALGAHTRRSRRLSARLVIDRPAVPGIVGQAQGATTAFAVVAELVVAQRYCLAQPPVTY